MRVRSNKTRMADLRVWLLKNPKADLSEFTRMTLGTHHQWYYLRSVLGISPKKPEVLAEARKAVVKRGRPRKTVEAPPVTQKEEVKPSTQADQKVIDTIVEEATPDFIWYELDLMQQKLNDVSLRLNHVVKIARARDADQKKMMRELIGENSELRVESRALRQQVSELTEMINGAPV